MSLISRSTNYSNNVNLYNELNNSINEIDVFVSGNKSKKDVREKTSKQSQIGLVWQLED